MTEAELALQAEAWIRYWKLPNDGSPERWTHNWASDLHDLLYDDPETLWALILEIHKRDQSTSIQGVLAAGPIEDLLAQHGDAFIDRVEAQARKDGDFAKVLGGVWRQNTMNDAVWDRLQAAWDRGS